MVMTELNRQLEEIEAEIASLRDSQRPRRGRARLDHEVRRLERI